jgi:hypothetical protein
VLVLLFAVAAAPAAAGDRPAVDEVRGCSTRGDGSRPAQAPPGGVRIGPLVVWPTVHRTGRTANAEWPYATKSPILLAARARVVLAIAPEAASEVAMWRQRGGYATAVRFEACREREPSHGYRGTVGKLTGFPFAFELKAPSACVPVELWIDGRDEPLRTVLAVGRSAC